MPDPTGKPGLFTLEQIEEIASQMGYYSSKIRSVIGVMQAHNITEIVTKNAKGPERARASMRRWLQALDMAVEEVVVSKNTPIAMVPNGTETQNDGPE